MTKAKNFFKKIINDKSILDAKKKWYFTADTPDIIRDRLSHQSIDVTIQLWTPSLLKKFAYRNTTAFQDNWVIYVNTYFWDFENRSECDVVDTLVHESTHSWGYAHDGDSEQGNQDTFPYWAGHQAYSMCVAGIL